MVNIPSPRRGITDKSLSRASNCLISLPHAEGLPQVEPNGRDVLNILSPRVGITGSLQTECSTRSYPLPIRRDCRQNWCGLHHMSSFPPCAEGLPYCTRNLQSPPHAEGLPQDARSIYNRFPIHSLRGRITVCLPLRRISVSHLLPTRRNFRESELALQREIISPSCAEGLPLCQTKF